LRVEVTKGPSTKDLTDSQKKSLKTILSSKFAHAVPVGPIIVLRFYCFFLYHCWREGYSQKKSVVRDLSIADKWHFGCERTNFLLQKKKKKLKLFENY